MSLYTKMKGLCVGMLLVLACGVVAFGQESKPGPEGRGPGGVQHEGRRGGMRREGMHKGMGVLRGLRELNLTEAQHQQVRSIMERFVETTKPQREALMQLREQREQGATDEQLGERAKQLRGEIRTAMQSARAEVVAILTPEQRTQLEKMEQEHKARRDERRKRYDDEQ